MLIDSAATADVDDGYVWVLVQMFVMTMLMMMKELLIIMAAVKRRGKSRGLSTNEFL